MWPAHLESQARVFISTSNKNGKAHGATHSRMLAPDPIAAEIAAELDGVILDPRGPGLA